MKTLSSSTLPVCIPTPTVFPVGPANVYVFHEAPTTLFDAVTNPGISGTNPLDGDPRFVDPAGGDYHLGAGSAAIDVGVDAGVTIDIDGDPRPLGLPDIGADEYVVARIRLPLILRNY